MATGANHPSLLDSEPILQRVVATESSTIDGKLEALRNRFKERLTEITARNKGDINVMETRLATQMEHIIQMMDPNKQILSMN
ncbi:unnamed protein product [Dimorphilus gyrociliatus]|uniref:Uncharacterized protein n=1 Tax=Dimorphilus gyrociliatus TaxID=2664684 RepID=A0A7I8VX56_9ANNE|nr:unnamed protein product [Dimorphilus gyrociliatus]